MFPTETPLGIILVGFLYCSLLEICVALVKNAPILVRSAFLCYNGFRKIKEFAMIGKNIKSLRKTHDLTQDDFARIVGISRNSLSRYENGTSSVSTELIDIICQKFNVSYVDIVGEDKMLNPVEDYELTLKIEIVKERGANLLSRLYRYQDSQGISIDDESNPWILMSDDLSDLIHTNIYLVETFDEIERYSGYLDGIERMLEISEKRMVA